MLFKTILKIAKNFIAKNITSAKVCSNYISINNFFIVFINFSTVLKTSIFTINLFLQ